MDSAIGVPKIPLFGWAGSLPLFVDWLVLGVLLGSLASNVRRPDSRRSWIAFAVSLGVLIVLDQHRLQPWAWQLLLMAALVEFRQSGASNPSALHRVDHQHLFLVRDLEARCEFRGLTRTDFDRVAVSIRRHQRDELAGECEIVAGGFSSRRRVTGRHWIVLAAHSTSGLDCRDRVACRTDPRTGAAGLGTSAGRVVVEPGLHRAQLAAVRSAYLRVLHTNPKRQRGNIVADISCSLADASGESARLRLRLAGDRSRWGLCDRWLAWSVYSARSERVSVTLTDAGLRRLPESARSCVTDGELPLDRWSLAALDVPISPQLRFQFGVVEWLRRRCGEENLVEVIVQHSHGAVGEIERLTVEQCDEPPPHVLDQCPTARLIARRQPAVTWRKNSRSSVSTGSRGSSFRPLLNDSMNEVEFWLWTHDRRPMILQAFRLDVVHDFLRVSLGSESCIR